MSIDMGAIRQMAGDSAFEDTLAGDFRPFGDEVLLVDPILVTVCVGDWAAVFVWNQSLDIQGGRVYISHIKYMVETIGGQDDW